MAYIGQGAPQTFPASISNLTITGPLTVNGKFTASGETLLPAGTTAERPASPVAGSVRFNTTTNAYEG